MNHQHSLRIILTDIIIIVTAGQSRIIFYNFSLELRKVGLLEEHTKRRNDR